MNVLFLTMNVFTDIEMHNIYSDLMKEFIKHGHRPYIVTPREKQLGEATELIDYPEYSMLKVQIGNTSNVSLIEKGISTVTLSSQFYRAVKYKLGHLAFGLILYSTPPITLATPVAKLKKLFGCRTYLMLKDIFPQNAVDLGMFSNKSPIYWYFRSQEKKLYAVSDKIGCMSYANIKYVLTNNPQIDKRKVEICHNGIQAKKIIDRYETKKKLREKYGIMDSAIVYLYGGNLGKPQGVSFINKCLYACRYRNDCYFLICGEGSEYSEMDQYIEKNNIKNARLISYLPKEEYDLLAKGCDVGLVFLDYRFTIPNYPSRVLSYMENSMPILVCTDPVTDVGTDAVMNKYGVWCPSNDVNEFVKCIDGFSVVDIDEMGCNARKYLEKEFSSETCYRAIME